MPVNESLHEVLVNKYRATALKDLLKEPPWVLQGVSEEDADLLREAFNIETVEDMANNKLFRWAQAIQTLALTEKSVPAKAALPVLPDCPTAGIGITHHSDGRPIQGLAAQKCSARPHRSMLRIVKKGATAPVKGHCPRRWDVSPDGVALLHYKLTTGLVVNDPTYWQRMGYVTLTPATDVQVEAAFAAWQAGPEALADWAANPS